MGNIDLKPISVADEITRSASTPEASYRGANQVVGLVAIGLVVVYAIFAPSFENFICATLVSGAAILPTLLWISRQVKGVPCFPLFAGMHIFYFGAPFSIDHPAVEMYTASEKITAALTVVAYLVLATVVWAVVGHVQKKRAAHCLMFDPRGSVHRYLGLMVLAVMFSINAVSGTVSISGEVVGLIRPFVLGLSTISVFLMAYNYGARTLTQKQKAIFLILLVAFVLTQTASLLLISAYTTLASGLAGYWLSARRLPKVAIVVVCLFLVLFQAGKYEMRRLYMEDGYFTLMPYQYPQFFGTWLGYGAGSIASQVGLSTAGKSGAVDDTESISLLARASLVHMLLLTETIAPSSVPFLGGDSYAGIPELLLPRILFPDKGSISDAMLRLSIQFGVLPFDSEGTSVAWGLLPEAYANFGYFGVVGLATVLGAIFGLFARASTGYSVFSVRAIASIVVITCIFGMESHAAAAISTIFQSMAAVIIASLIFAHTARNPGSEI